MQILRQLSFCAQTQAQGTLSGKLIDFLGTTKLTLSQKQDLMWKRFRF